MGLVDYSDSDSESEAAAPPPAPAPAARAASAPAKKPIQKLVNSANPSKIQISLPSIKPETAPSDEPPAKRAKTSGGGSRFSNFGSFLPAPKTKTTAAPPPPTASGGGSAPRPGVHLKTSGEAAFSRDGGGGGGGGSAMGLPPAKAPSIPEGQKPADEVQLVGKPLMFKPLSVARKPAKKGVGKKAGMAKAVPAAAPVRDDGAVGGEQAPVKKVSLFSLSEEAPAEPSEAITDEDTWDPNYDASEPPLDAFDEGDGVTGPYDAGATYQAPAGSTHPAAAGPSLAAVAHDMNLTRAQRRQLFGRDGAAAGATVVSFDTEREYAHNEVLRASGEAVQHNPLRALQPGKHSLKQLVNAVQGQREALEENFAKNRANQKESGSRYGWR